jgi:hypothetical protein
MGDGALVEFPSVVEAVQCAVEVQRGVAKRNAGVPDDRRMAFRIGVNLGDIIIEDDDIHGDGSTSPHGSRRSRNRAVSAFRPRYVCRSRTSYPTVSST